MFRFLRHQDFSNVQSLEQLLGMLQEMSDDLARESSTQDVVRMRWYADDITREVRTRVRDPRAVLVNAIRPNGNPESDATAAIIGSRAAPGDPGYTLAKVALSGLTSGISYAVDLVFFGEEVD